MIEDFQKIMYQSCIKMFWDSSNMHLDSQFMNFQFILSKIKYNKCGDLIIQENKEYEYGNEIEFDECFNCQFQYTLIPLSCLQGICLDSYKIRAEEEQYEDNNNDDIIKLDKVQDYYPGLILFDNTSINIFVMVFYLIYNSVMVLFKMRILQQWKFKQLYYNKHQKYSLISYHKLYFLKVVEKTKNCLFIDVNSVCFSPDGTTIASIASGSGDKTIHLWNVMTGQSKGILNGHSDSVQSICFSPDGATLASGSYDKSFRLWDVKLAQQIAQLNGQSDRVQSVCFSPDGTRLASNKQFQDLNLCQFQIQSIDSEAKQLAVFTLKDARFQ